MFVNIRGLKPTATMISRYATQKQVYPGKQQVEPCPSGSTCCLGKFDKKIDRLRFWRKMAA